MSWNTIFSKLGVPPGYGDDIVIYLFVLCTIILLTFMIRGLIKKDKKWRYAIFGFLIGMFVLTGVIVGMLYILSGLGTPQLWIQHLITYLIDPISSIYCLGICKGFFGLPYIFTIPISQGIYGLIIGYLLGKYKKSQK